MSLSPEQIERRKKYVGASDANIIMSGDAEKILNLFRIKRGEQEPEDLSRVLPVQMGSFTEPLNIRWFELESGKTVVDQGLEIFSDEFPWLMATLDGAVNE
jgi:hypothetical protein